MAKSLKKKMNKLYDNHEFVDIHKMQAMLMGQFVRQINDGGFTGFEPWRVLQEFERIFMEAYNFEGEKCD